MKFIYFLLLCVALCACERKSGIGGGDDAAATENASAQVAGLQKKLDTFSKAGDGIDTAQVVKLQKEIDKLSETGDGVDTAQVVKLQKEIDKLSETGADIDILGPQEEVDESVTVYCGCRRGSAWSIQYRKSVKGVGASEKEAVNDAKRICKIMYANVSPARPYIYDCIYTDDPEWL